MHIEEVNKIVLSSDGDKRLQTFEKLQHIHTEHDDNNDNKIRL